MGGGGGAGVATFVPASYSMLITLDAGMNIMPKK